MKRVALHASHSIAHVSRRTGCLVVLAKDRVRDETDSSKTRREGSMPVYELTINGSVHQVDVDAGTPLLWVLRDTLKLTGTKYGCGKGLCGVCTVHANGMAVRSCQMPVEGAAAMEIATVEGVSENGLHPAQEAWMEENVSQCGYCQSGQIMNAISLLEMNSDPSKAEIDSTMRGNLCRCGTYPRIEKAIIRAAKKMRGGQS